MLKRVSLFLLTNLAILLVLGVVLRIVEATGLLGQIGEVYGIQIGPILVFAAVFGFGGAFISLLLSKTIAKWSTGAQVIAQPRNEMEGWLVATVQRLAQKSGIGMPEVAIYDSPDMNAFATGARRDNALVAVSTGLLRSMQRDEVEAVLGHEIAHVANGDMVTLTLIQGVLNTFVIFVSRLVGMIVDSALRGGEERRFGYGPGYWITTIVMEIFLGIGATIIVMWFSRMREFRADMGSAGLLGAPKMIAALHRLRGGQPSHLPEAMAAFGIRGGRAGGMMSLFRSHPPLEERIARLEKLRATSQFA